MANTDIPAGFTPIKHLNGMSWCGKVNTYYIPATDSTALFIGDAVKSGGSADATGKFPTVTQVTAGDAVRGVIVGFGEDPHTMVQPVNEYRTHRAANEALYCLVVDDPDVIFEIQEDGVGGTLAATSVGLSADIIVGTGNTVNGKSGMELDSSTASVNAATMKILRLMNREDNALGEHAKWEILFGEHEMRLSTGV